MQGRLSYYGDYARALAGWGYAVLQYDLACWTAAPKLLQSVPCPQLDNIADEVRRARARCHCAVGLRHTQARGWST